jgi:hypothetical protein
MGAMRAGLLALVLASSALLAGCPHHPDLALGPPTPAGGWPAVAPLSPTLGGTLAAAQESDFFGFFHWTQASREPTADGGSDVTFKPPAESMFPDVVVLHLALDRGEAIHAMKLRVARGFIDGEQGIFARDVVKSFLRAAVPAGEEPAIDALATEIEVRGLDPDAVLPPTPSVGFQVFAGQAATSTQDFAHAQLLLSSSTDWLELSFEGR